MTLPKVGSVIQSDKIATAKGCSNGGGEIYLVLINYSLQMPSQSNYPSFFFFSQCRFLSLRALQPYVHFRSATSLVQGWYIVLTCTAPFSDTLEWQELDMKEEHMVLPLKCSPESLFRNGNPPSGSHFSATRVAALIFCKLQFSTRRALPVFMLGNWPRCLSQSSAPPQRDQDLAVNETGPKGGRFQISTRESTRPCWQIRL